MKYLQFSILLLETLLSFLGFIVYFFPHVNCALFSAVLTIPLHLAFSSTLSVVSALVSLPMLIKNAQTISVSSFFHTLSATPRLSSIHLFFMFYLTFFSTQWNLVTWIM